MDTFKENKKVILAFVFLLLLLRTVVVYFFLGDRFVWSDEANDIYPQAMRIFQGEGWGDQTKMMPLFPLLMAGIFYVSQGDILVTRLILTLLNAGLIFVVYALAKELFDTRVALLSALIIAVYPIVIFSSALLLPEALFTLFICMGIWSFLKIDEDRRHLWLASLFFGCASLTISLTIPFLVFSIFILFYALEKERVKRRVYLTLAYSILFVALLAGWGARNYISIGSFFFVKGNFGEVLYHNNNVHVSGFARGENYAKTKDLREGFGRKLEQESRIKSNQFYLTEVKAFVLTYPEKFARLCLERFLNLWRFYPGTISENSFTGHVFKYVSIFTYGPIFILSLIGFMVGLKRWRSQLIIYAYLVSLIVIFTIVRSSIRARLPLEPFLVIYASLGGVYIFDYLRNRGTSILRR